MDFVNLYTQTSYSFCGSNINIKELVSKAKTLNYKALAITDYNNMYGVIKFYNECKKSSIKPIIGMVFDFESDSSKSCQLIALAKNNIGYNNLMSISSFIKTNDRPIDKDTFLKYRNGIIVISQGDFGDIFNYLIKDDILSAKRLYQSYLDTFEEFYLGIELNDYEIEINIAPKIKQLGRSIVLNKVLYLDKEDKLPYRVLENIFKGHKLEENALFEESSTNYLKTKEEIYDIYSEYKDEIILTSIVSEKCNVTIDFTSYHLPKFKLSQDISTKIYLRELSKRGLAKRLKNKSVEKSKYFHRLDHELDIIDKMGFNDYFLIVWDFVKYAKKKGILVGPGRGSTAGSLVSYVLGIVDVDPIEHDLFFERFLNPERITMPDIDLDFPDDKRDDIIKYVVNKYGKKHVASIVTFGTFAPRSAIRDVGRILDIASYKIDEIIKHIPLHGGNLSEIISSNISIRKLINDNYEIENLLNIASKIEGLPRHTSTHAAGIIISKEPIYSISPVQNGLLDMYQTQYEASDLEKLGLLKMDFLGLRNLSIIKKILGYINKYEKKDIDIYKIPFDDKKTIELLRNVNTTGVFQLESKGMRNLISKMQMSSFDDIVACLALFRPGPMENIPTFLSRKFNKEEINYPHPSLEPILKNTYGVIVYQEQIMQIANIFAGYSMGEADLLRRAMSKKQGDILKSERDRFIKKSNIKGYDCKTSNLIYDYIVKFANYGFNKSHSVAYAVISYWLAYLKANYPKYFMVTLLSSVIGSETQISNYIYECYKMKINVLPPSINNSSIDFEVEGDSIRYPILGVKNIGLNTAMNILKIRKEEPFKNYVDFVTRTKKVVNNRIVEALVNSGTLDDFEINHSTMNKKYIEILNYSEFGNFIDINDFNIKDIPEYSYEKLCENEESSLGFNLQMHPINKHSDYINKHGLMKVSDINDNHVGKIVKVVGYCKYIREITSKNNKLMSFIEFNDAFSKIDTVLFSDIYEEYKNIIDKNCVYLFKGKVDRRNNKLQVVISNLFKL